MNSTGKSLESAQSAIAANFTACLSRTKSLLFCELGLRIELGVLGSQSFQLGAFGIVHGVLVDSLDSLAFSSLISQCDLGHTDVTRNLDNRTPIVDGERYHLGLVLVGMPSVSNQFLCLPKDRATSRRVHRTGNGLAAFATLFMFALFDLKSALVEHAHRSFIAVNQALVEGVVVSPLRERENWVLVLAAEVEVGNLPRRR
jgi:hypothetical protein